MGGNFLGALAGEIGQHIHERHIQDYNAAIQSKQNTLDAYKALGSDPHMQDMWGQIAQAQLQAAAADPRKFMGGKIPKDLDPQQWFQLQSQRSMGLSPSPANQGQNPTSIPAPAAGQMPGQAQQAMPWNAYQQNTDDPGAPGQGAPAGGAGPIPPPPGVSASPPPNAPSASQGQATMPGGMINRTGSSVDGTPSMAQPNQPGQPPGMGGVGPSSNGANVGGPSPQVAALAGGTAAQSIQALPPNPAAGGAPSSVTAVSPQQAAAIMPPPPVASSTGYGFPDTHRMLTSQEVFQRKLDQEAEAMRRQGATSLEVQQHKLQAIEPYLQGVDPHLANIMRMEIIQGGTGSAGASALLNTIFAAPQARRVQLPDGTLGIEYVNRFGNVVANNQGYGGVRQTGVDASGRPVYEGVNQILQGGGQGAAITPGGSPVMGVSEASQLNNLRKITLPDGREAYVSASQLKDEKQPLLSGGVNPAMLPSQHSLSSTTDASGNTTSTSTTRKVVPGVGGLAIPPPPGISTAPRSTGGGAGGTGGGAAAVRPEIQRYAEDKRDGKSPTIPAKDQDAVTKYMVAQGWATPTALSATGSRNIAALQPVVDQVDDLLARLRPMKDNNNPLALMTDYQLYKRGLANSNTDLFTNLSFERLRSAASALKGMNSRSYPILMKALEHTPTLDRMGGLNPDSPKMMYDKLMQMKNLLRQGRNSVLADEKKSGVIGKPDESGIAGAPPSTSVVDDLIKQYK